MGSSGYIEWDLGVHNVGSVGCIIWDLEEHNRSIEYTIWDLGEHNIRSSGTQYESMGSKHMYEVQNIGSRGVQYRVTNVGSRVWMNELL